MANRMIQVRISPVLDSRLQAEARRLGISPSEMVRIVLADKLASRIGGENHAQEVINVR